MTDFRALCAELAALDGHCVVDCTEEWADAMYRLRTALAQPEPQEVPPMTAEEHGRFCAEIIKNAQIDLAQPEPQKPTDEEIHQLWQELYIFHDGPTSGEVAEIARAVLARWGCTAIEPVSVTERLPGPEDCAPWPDEPDANPWCWAGKEVDGGWEWDQIGMLGVDAKNLGRVLGGGGWTHWLPHHALPVPQQEAG